ncbi:hypothetical protein DASC09_029650 [Saccharomycopsis crataegensis]|uniref:EIF3F/CSN6-like C-terminal domain-containing protein n=1 Tax=Saccharomycopsis crataegensis TaxID=43959 RepID=A0AAV5QM73_9ASCO|nr:hypothetical protein DASC09_029650 [Saccharomycopsis crataegensis]
MKFHPLVWLSISDFLQREGTGLIGLYGSATAIITVLDMPLTDDGTINNVYLKKKIKQLNVTNAGSQLKGLVVKKGEVQLSSTQSHILQLLEVAMEEDNNNNNNNEELYVLELDESDFIEEDNNQRDAKFIGKLKSQLYKFDISTKTLVGEKLEFESLDPEKSAINSIINNNTQIDDLHSLNSVLVSKKSALSALTLKLDTIIHYLENVKTGNKPADQDILNKIGGLVALVTNDGPDKDSEVVKAFEEKDLISNFASMLGLMSDSLHKNTDVLATNMDMIAEL